MKLLRIGEPGGERPAVMDATGRIWLLPEDIGDIDAAFFASGGVERARTLLESRTLSEAVVTRFGAPLAAPGKIICIGLNYRDHALETNSPIPTEPVVFMKAPSCVVGPNDQVLIPRGSQKTDWEVELGVVIGVRARYLESPSDAPGVIAGYVLANDVSERSFQIERGGQWDKGKSCETFCPLGPWIATKDEVLDAQNLSLRLSVNGVVRQDGTTSQMIFDVDYVIWYLSQFLVLEAGDLVITGTPPGVSLGHDDVPFLKAGDVMELSITGLGTHRSELVQA
ncbi:MAG TPA: fumarylacetoacetate hydrolase family protein [Acidimicrobiales bacterium]